MISLHERATGAYLGLAIGDALGAPVEFMTAGEIRNQHGTLRRMVGGGWLRLKPGQVTDDTEMSLRMGRAILASRGWNLKALADQYADWLRSHPIDVGNTCRRGIQRYITHGTLVGPESEGDGGNGAAMRVLPLALAMLHDDAGFASAALEQAHFTHHHPYSDAGTLALGNMVRQLVRGEPLARARAEADALVAKHRQFRYAPYPGRASGYIVDTVQTVFHGFFSTDNFKDCLISVVNRGEDADTTGAIVGMLAGAQYGRNAIPTEWLRKLDPAVRQEIEAQTEALLIIARRNAP